MHMMFVDESGDPGYPKNGIWNNWGGSVQFCRVGVIIHGWKWKAWNDRLLQFKNNRGLTWDIELKSANIRRGSGPFVGWDAQRRDLFMQDLIQLIGGTEEISLIGVSIDKRKVMTNKKDRFVKPQIRSLEFLLERYNQFLGQQKDKSGIVVLDPTKESNDDNLRYFQNYLLAHSEHLRPLHIVESTFFAKSHTSNMVQVADICTNIFYREMVRQSNSAEYRVIHPRFWKHNGRIIGYGIKTWP